MNRKRGCLIAGITVPIALIILIIAPFFVSPVLNDFRLNCFANSLFKYPLPENTKVIEKTQKVGCLIGNGNHRDFLVIMRISSSLNKEQLQTYYNKARIPSAMSGHDDTRVEVFLKEEAEEPFDSRGVYEKKRDIDNKGVMITKETNGDKEYIIQIFDSGYPAGFDIRCH